MSCPRCSATLSAGYKFCGNCGLPAGAATQTCSGCGCVVSYTLNFCPNCGRNMRASAGGHVKQMSPQRAVTLSSKEIAPGETVLMDTGFFPITYVNSNINGKLHLTDHRLLFTAGKLQGVGGVAVGDIFIPNPHDAMKSKEHFSISLTEITNVNSGWATLTIHAGGKEHKFGGMRETKQWAEAIRNAITSYR